MEVAVSKYLPLSTRLLVMALPLALLYVFLRMKQRSKFRRKVDKIPGPPGYPLFGNGLLALNNRVSLYRSVMVNLRRDYGPVYRLWMLNNPHVVLHRAQDVKLLLRNPNMQNKSQHYKVLESLDGGNVLTSNGEKWNTSRKTIVPAFNRSLVMKNMAVFAKHSAEFTKALSRRTASDETALIMPKYTKKFMLDSLIEFFTGFKCKTQSGEHEKVAHASIRVGILAYINMILLNIPSFIYSCTKLKKEMTEHLKTLSNFIDEVIEEGEEAYAKKKSLEVEESSDFEKQKNSSMLDLMFESERMGSKYFTRTDTKNQLHFTLLLGSDVTSIANSWVLFLLGCYNDCQDRVVEELEKVFGDSGRAATYEDLANLKYLDRCIKETLRLYPAVPFIERAISQDLQLEDYLIPAGCNVDVNICLLHRDPAVWSDPDKFDPDRFLPENVKGRDPFCYIPFSAGARNCMGEKLVHLLIKSSVSTLLRKFRVEPACPREELKVKIGISLFPQNNIKVRLHERGDRPQLRVTE